MNRAAFVIGFLLVGMLVPADVAQAQRARETIAYKDLASYYGLTYCTDHGVYSVVAVGLSALDEADTKAHELKHQEQYRRLKLPCGAFQRHYSRPKNKLDMEAEAYGAGYCVQLTMGADPISLFQNFAERIQYIMGGEINRLEVIAALRRYTVDCP